MKLTDEHADRLLDEWVRGGRPALLVELAAVVGEARQESVTRLLDCLVEYERSTGDTPAVLHAVGLGVVWDGDSWAVTPGPVCGT